MPKGVYGVICLALSIGVQKNTEELSNNFRIMTHECMTLHGIQAQLSPGF